MSSRSSDSEIISQCEFETTSELGKESISGCYNNEYSHEEIDKMKEKNGSVSKKMILGRITQHGAPVRTASFMRI